MPLLSATFCTFCGFYYYPQKLFRSARCLNGTECWTSTHQREWNGSFLLTVKARMMSKSKLTVEQIEKMSYQQMIKACPEVGIKYDYQKKEELTKLLTEAIENGGTPIESSTEEPSLEQQYSEEVLEIIDHPMLNKSDKMRELYDAGITKPAEIAKLTNAHYSFVYTVLSKYKNKEKPSE
jgi:Glu-tRNA(Gln) amidotransferase subunit E-like FAD-binding protein